MGVLRAILELLRLFFSAIVVLYLCFLSVSLLEHAHLYLHIPCQPYTGASMIISFPNKK